MPGVPAAVPDREPLASEQVGAVDVRGQVDGVRLEDGVGDGADSGGRYRGEAPQVESGARHCGPGGRRRGHDALAMKSVMSSIVSGRSSQGQCPAQLTISTRVCPPSASA